MKQIEREALAVLKNFTKMSKAEWKMVEIQVAQRGITNVKGVVLQELQYCAEKARGAVAKHPGHANQSAHGNGGSKGGAAGSGSTAGGSADFVQTTQMSVQSFDGLNTLHVDLAQMSVGVTGDTRAQGARHYNAAGRHIKAAELLTGKAAEVAGTDKKAANGLLVRAKVQMNMAAEQGFAMKTALGVTGSDSRYNAFDQKVGGIISQLNAAIRYSGVSKAVEPVEKHPGHPNQASHGNGGSKGGATGAGGETSANGDATPGQAIDEMGEGNDEAQDILDNGLDENELENMSFADGESLNLAQEQMEIGLGHVEMIDPMGSEERLNGIRAQRALNAFGEASFHLRSSDHPVLQEAGMTLKDMVESVSNKSIDWNGSGNPAKASSY